MIVIDGTNKITITAKQIIQLTNGKSSLTMDAGMIILSNGDSVLTMNGATTTLTATSVDIGGTADACMHSGDHGFSAKSGGDVDMQGTKSTITGSAEAKITGAKTTLNGDSEATVISSGPTSLQGAIVKLN